MVCRATVPAEAIISGIGDQRNAITIRAAAMKRTPKELGCIISSSATFRFSSSVIWCSARFILFDQRGRNSISSG
jgi:hypothetical protein